jgi:putative SOS response-associated peptidase YedK
MCIHYQFFTSAYKDLVEYAELNPNQPAEAWERDLWPKRRGLIIKQHREPAVMSWGFPHPTLNKPVPNARIDKLGSPMWKGAFRHNRCLIPLTDWFENGIDKRQYALKLPDPIFCVAGLHNGRNAYTMLMTEANPFIERFHDRMPIVIHKKDFDQWLNEPAIELLVPYAGEIMATCVAEPKAKATRPIITKPPPEHYQGDLFT